MKNKKLKHSCEIEDIVVTHRFQRLWVSYGDQLLRLLSFGVASTAERYEVYEVYNTYISSKVWKVDISVRTYITYINRLRWLVIVVVRTTTSPPPPPRSPATPTPQGKARKKSSGTWTWGLQNRARTYIWYLMICVNMYSCPQHTTPSYVREEVYTHLHLTQIMS